MPLNKNSTETPFILWRYVRGEPDGDYEYVSPDAVDAESNYSMGRRLCAHLTGKLVGDAKKWWEDYDSRDKEAPNCWKKHNTMRRPAGNGGMEEISLFELLTKKFSGEVDARTAETELSKCNWEPFEEGSQTQSVTAFQTHREAHETSSKDRYIHENKNYTQCITIQYETTNEDR